MRVCIVSLNIVPFFQRQTGSHYGGAEAQAAIVARALESRGVEVVLVVADGYGELPFPSENAFRTGDGMPGIRFFHPRLSGILDALERADADVYFQRNTGMITGVTSWFCRRHNRAFVYGAGSDTDFSSREARAGNLRDRVMYFYGLRNAHGIVVQNNIQAAACRERLGREPKVIPNAIDTSDGGSDIPKERMVVWVGALREIKRPDRFIELARRLPDVRFVMIGGGVGSEPDYAERILSEASMVENLTATGRIEPEGVDDYLKRAALLVNTSRVEGFPNAFLEAWRRRTPTLSFVDVDNLLTQHGAGVVCRDDDDLAAQTRALLEDDRLAEMGLQASRLVEERFSADVIGSAYVDYFEALRSGNS